MVPRQEPWRLERLLACECFVEQAKDGSGQQNDERPNHAPNHPLENVNPCGLSFNLGLEFGDRRDIDGAAQESREWLGLDDDHTESGEVEYR